MFKDYETSRKSLDNPTFRENEIFNKIHNDGLYERKLNMSQDNIACIDALENEPEIRRFSSLDVSDKNNDFYETTNLVDKSLFSEHMHPMKSENKTIMKSNWIVTRIPLTRDEAILKLKYMIRKGIPTIYISLTWSVITGGYEAMAKTPKLYFHNLNEMFGNNISGNISNYPLFGGKLSIKEHFLKGHASNVVKRLLCVYGMTYPRLQFLPPLPDIICLLLHYLKEEETFFCVNEILKEVLNSRKHLVFNKVGWSTVILIFDELVKLYFPKVWSLMTKKLNMTTTRPFSERWFFRLFIEDLPMRAVLTIFGSYLCEGLNVLFKVGLAIIKTYKLALFECDSEEALVNTIRELSHQIDDLSQFLKNAFSFKVSKVVKKLFSTTHNINFYKSSTENISSIYYRPEISKPSSIACFEDWEAIYQWMPSKHKLRNPHLLYTSEVNGLSLNSIFNKVGDSHPTILLIKSGQNKVSIA